VGNRKTPTKAKNLRTRSSTSKHGINDLKYADADQIHEPPTSDSEKNEPIQPSPRLVASRMNGAKGGRTTAERYGPEFCQQRAEKAGRATLARYGREYYRHIAHIRHAKKVPYES
jgi:hypothetical protein